MYSGNKTQHAKLLASELINMPVDAMIGITDSIKECLAQMTIFTIGDLGCSQYFLRAQFIYKYTNSNFIPSDWLDQNFRNYEVEKIKDQSTEILLGISNQTAENSKI